MESSVKTDLKEAAKKALVELPRKVSSRKFLLCLAAFLGTLFSKMEGVIDGNTAIIGMAVVAAIYNLTEAMVDRSAAAANTTSTETKVSASSTGAAANEVVSAVLAPSEKEASNG